MSQTKYTSIDLFCGCGGSSQGYITSGIDVVAGIDIWDVAIKTYNNNLHPDDPKGLCRDLITYIPEMFVQETGISEIDILTGSPPCQGVSMGGRRDTDDKRNNLFFEYIKWLNYFKPKAFIMENVVGILSMKNPQGEKILDTIMTEFKKDYRTEYYTLMASDFQVPQNRKRVIFIGLRNDLWVNPIKPIGDPNNRIPIKAILEEDVPRSYYLSQRAIDGINKRKEKMKEKGHGFGAQFVDLEKPCYTIPARYWKDGYDALVKYSEDEIRRLTIKELTAIQSFPMDFQFVGTKKDIIMQIGNAVSCKLAEAIGRCVISLLDLGEEPLTIELI